MHDCIMRKGRAVFKQTAARLRRLAGLFLTHYTDYTKPEAPPAVVNQEEHVPQKEEPVSQKEEPVFQKEELVSQKEEPVSQKEEHVPHVTEAKEDGDSHQVCARNSMLENLPAEIHRMILSRIGIVDLRHLVSASPILHQRYLHDRRYLLCKCLEVTLGRVAVDAHAVHLASPYDFFYARDEKTVSAFIDSYHERRSSALQRSFSEILTEDEAVSMVQFYLTVMKPLAELYVGWALANLAAEAKTPEDSHVLSRTEEIRLLRGLYRFELCCKLFGERILRIPERRRWSVRLDSSILESLLLRFEPWEAEEIVCVYEFSQDTYVKAYMSIAWDISYENPKFGPNAHPFMEGTFEFWDTGTVVLEGHISCGAKLLLRTLNFPDKESIISLLEKRAIFESIPPRPLPFLGDMDPATGPSLPPLAWTMIFREIYVTVFASDYHFFFTGEIDDHYNDLNHTQTSNIGETISCISGESAHSNRSGGSPASSSRSVDSIASADSLQALQDFESTIENISEQLDLQEDLNEELGLWKAGLDPNDHPPESTKTPEMEADWKDYHSLQDDHSAALKVYKAHKFPLTANNITVELWSRNMELAIEWAEASLKY
ncbi:hypothetical protein E4U41_000689 [Claviceps citrina]|nr:hypothetical protein E4U41_000689 [Claviceps citrina]